ncbi:MAG: GDSL-type esterase/lipase family protein [Oscillospiraceae bacterium]|nr:GDSL-type esterase/lipase family protein [Oscillospiraceae bacterium]
MKNFFCVLISALMLISLCACGNKPGNGESTKAPESSTGEPASTTKPVSTSQPASTTKPASTSEPAGESESASTTETTGTSSGSPHTASGALPESKKVSSDYFDDAVFVGDSITLKLSYYEAANDVLGKAQFLTSGSLSATNALMDVSDKSVHPRYKGKKMKLEKSIPLTGAKKVYIMLGMNDINLSGIDGSIENFKKLCKNIKKNAPYVKFYVQSVTPRVAMTSSSTSKSLTNAKIAEYNKKLSKCCDKQGWYYLDVASVMKDSKGNLKKEYCGDPDTLGMHFTNAGCEAWVDYLYTHTA